MSTLYYESRDTDPAFNLALEEYVFGKIPKGTTLFMLWQNDNAVIIGKNQNAAAEIDRDYVLAHGIKVVRRLSGGGAVYHDLGNLNYTFISDTDLAAIDFETFCRPVIRALGKLGVEAELTGRNDICIGGRKISGNAQYARRGRVMHHGTLLFDSDLSVVAAALQADPEKFRSKATRSVRSRVTNIAEHLPRGTDLEGFRAALRETILADTGARALILGEEDLEAIHRIKKDRYDTWEWNFGTSPAYDTVRKGRFEGAGTLELHMNVKRGRITEAKLFGDFFGSDEIGELTDRLIGLPLRADALRGALAETCVEQYCHGLTAEELIGLITG